MNLNETAHAILAPIGYDMARVGELSEDNLYAVHQVQSGANLHLFERLVDITGSRTMSQKLVDLAGAMPREKRNVLCEELAKTPEGAPPKPTALAAHISMGLGIEEMLAVEIERRASGQRQQ